MPTAFIPNLPGPARSRAAAITATVLPVAALAFACLDGALVYAAGLLLWAFGAR
ncbi:hypothetical protein IHQ68_06485 [Chelatococcus sambhunathii]|uniref:Uncharacterized protein n=1 Tax=Chelatococcus sambhunathii TaxID=363953 RepID=A0ABU1DDR5_9HYPH|nr:hypothetical protein [Chelatococcus sambhunathii]MDR4306263.1 hypothetical protein [Chelatococcus sambhunathii]